MGKSRFVRFTLPPIVWAALIFIESSIPGNDIPETPHGTDKLVHIVIYFIFCWLTFRALSNAPSRVVAQMSFFIAIVLTILYGFSDEFHQLFVPGRSADVYDLTADSIGGFLFLVIALFQRYRSGKGKNLHNSNGVKS
ncbi:MAG TPA: VanZ family protein [Bacteroidota bacterium]|nr:VanZ family protein [Bacteroidota bacterium]